MKTFTEKPYQKVIDFIDVAIDSGNKPAQQFREITRQSSK